MRQRYSDKVENYFRKNPLQRKLYPKINPL